MFTLTNTHTCSFFGSQSLHPHSADCNNAFGREGVEFHPECKQQLLTRNECRAIVARRDRGIRVQTTKDKKNPAKSQSRNQTS